ncbi:hypothetical protein BDZ97DRAFT_1844649 [Flammula alnicola]|nr:hypothetical protein BDZ97DRAFT_1844649 [Flammula alnicola]
MVVQRLASPWLKGLVPPTREANRRPPSFSGEETSLQSVSLATIGSKSCARSSHSQWQSIHKSGRALKVNQRISTSEFYHLKVNEPHSRAILLRCAT